MHGLRDMGFQAEVVSNKTDPDAVNIIIGVHLLVPSIISRVPKKCIVLNTEQIYSDNTPWISNIVAWAKKFPVWDYNQRNIEKWNELGVMNVGLLRLGYHPMLERIPKDNKKDIDVLFYGSIGERRGKILNELAAAGLNLKTVFGIYGRERDELISRSKVVINIHHYDSKIFEVVRVFYLMTNAKAVVSEVDEFTYIDEVYLSGVRSAPYKSLTDACLELVASDEKRTERENCAYETIKKVPQAQELKSLISGISF